MATLSGTLFVRIEGALPEGFQNDIDYPVFAIDVIDDEETRFLLANRAGQFAWINMNQTRRASNRSAPSGPDRQVLATHLKTPPQFRKPAR